MTSKSESLPSPDFTGYPSVDRPDREAERLGELNVDCPDRDLNQGPRSDNQRKYIDTTIPLISHESGAVLSPYKTPLRPPHAMLLKVVVALCGDGLHTGS